MAQPLLPSPLVSEPLSERAVPLRGAATALGVFVLLLGTSLAGGSYFPGAWGWPTIACAWAAGIALLLDAEAALTRLATAAVLLLLGFVGWVALSGVWSIDATQTGLEVQRDLVCVVALLAMLLAAGRSGDTLLRGTWAGVAVVSTYGLLTRLLPELIGANDPTSGYRLSEPLGYWNSLGLFAAMGSLLALGVAARDERPWLRALAAASVPVQLATIYFTFSRGAWIALAGGTLAALVLERRRLQLLATAAAIAPFAAIALAVAWHSKALTTPGSPLSEMEHQGHRLLWVLAGVALLSALALVALGEAERRVGVPYWVTRATAASLAAAVVVAVVAVSVAYGAPWSIAQRGWHSFAAAPPASATADLNNRLFSFSGTGRIKQWRVAWDEVQAHPVLGGGSGSYERYWDRHRPAAAKVSDVHNLYLEVLAELGPVGLALLVGVLLLPLVAAVRARRGALTAVAGGAYVAWLLHVIVDWDWEIVAVTLVMLACAAALLTGAGEPRVLPRPGRRATVVGLVLVTGIAVWLLGARVAITRAQSAAQKGDWTTALRDTRRAATLTPWSAEPWRRLGEAQLAGRQYADARESLKHALARDDRDWHTWLDLARASDGAQRANALDTAERLNPRGPEVVGFRKLLQSLSALAQDASS
jgi:hypothetical protein